MQNDVLKPNYSGLTKLQFGCSVLGIPYVLVAGSLLGAVRSRSLLFCDDDADIAVFEEDYAKVI
jgi:phosphorylcholine metabolism protein LicD